MRDDHQGAAAALRLLAKAILSVPSTDKRRMRAYLVRVGRMFRDNAIVRAAILELRRREENDETMFAEREQRIVQPASAAFRRLAESLSPSGPIRETTLQAAQQATSLPGRKIAPVMLGEMLKEARTSRLPDITLPDLPILSKAVERLLIDLRGFVDRDPAVDAPIREMEKILSSGKLADAALETQGLLGYLSIGRNVDILLNHADSPWDIEAGKLLLLEAGGKVTTKLYHNDKILSIYSNGIIHQAVESLLILSKDLPIEKPGTA